MLPPTVSWGYSSSDHLGTGCTAIIAYCTIGVEHCFHFFFSLHHFPFD